MASSGAARPPCLSCPHSLTALFLVVFAVHSCQALDWCIPHYYWREIEVGATYPEHPYNGSGITGRDLCSNFNSSLGYERNPWADYAHYLGDFAGDARLTWRNTPRFYWIRQPDEVVFYKITIEAFGDFNFTKRASRFVQVGNEPMEGLYTGKYLDRTFQIFCDKVNNKREYYALWYNMTIIKPIRRTLELKIHQVAFCNSTGPPTTPPITDPTKPATPPLDSQKSKSTNMWQVAVIVLVGVVLIAAACGAFVFFCYRYKRQMSVALDHEAAKEEMELHGCLIPAEEVFPEREIGTGAFGVVYLGTYRNQRVAIKTMKGDVGITQEKVLRFLQEAVAMKGFNHANLLNLIGVCLPSDSSPQIIVPYMDRGDLHTFLRRHNPDMAQTLGERIERELSDNELYAIMLQVALAMTYLSQKQFVHRDLAARNCMIDEDLVVKVGDFGLGRHTHDEMYYRAHSEFMLPVKWMAPESLKFYKFTVLSDVWSFGVLMWEVESLGRSPYPGISNSQIANFISGGNRLSQPEACPPAMYSIMSKCWQDDPTARPTFPAILELLEDYDRQQFHTMTASPLYESSTTVELGQGGRKRNASMSSFSDASNVTRSTLLTSTYVNTTRKGRSASVSSANPFSVQASPFSPISPGSHLPNIDIHSNNNNNVKVSFVQSSPMNGKVKHVDYSEMRAAIPQIPGPGNASGNGKAGTPSSQTFNPAPGTSGTVPKKNSTKPPPPPRNLDSAATSGSVPAPDDDVRRKRSLSDGAASVQRPSNLYITGPSHTRQAIVVDSMTSDGLSLDTPGIGNESLKAASPASPKSIAQSIVSEEVKPAEDANDLQMSKPMPSLPLVTSSYTPKEEGSLIGYENCLSVQQPSPLRGVETEA